MGKLFVPQPGELQSPDSSWDSYRSYTTSPSCFDGSSIPPSPASPLSSVTMSSSGSSSFFDGDVFADPGVALHVDSLGMGQSDETLQARSPHSNLLSLGLMPG